MKNSSLQAEIFKVLAHSTRLQIVELLREGEKCVCDIVPELGMEQSNISRHLNSLRKEGIVQCRKEGLKVFYWVSDPMVFEMMDLCTEMLKKQWATKQDATT